MTTTTLSLDQFLALNQEIAGLVRAGVPLEKNLGVLGQEMPGSLGRIAAEIAERAEQGESLEVVVAEQAAAFPPVYRAVIEAGMRAGRLPAALESLAGAVRRTAETRRAVITALLYPVIVFSLIWTFMALFTSILAPLINESLGKLSVPNVRIFQFLTNIGAWAYLWGPLGVILIVLGFYKIAYRWKQIASFGDERQWRRLKKIPWLGRMVTYTHYASFAELLAVLLEQETPLPDALRLAAGASGDSELLQSIAGVVEKIRSGRPIAGDEGLKILPPLLRWMLPAVSRTHLLLPALRRAATIYHEKADYYAGLLRIYVPLLLIVCVSGGLTLCYALALFIPYAGMLRALGGPF